MQVRVSFFLAALAVLLTGCLPSSCRREESRALFPSDSLSREVAALVQPDTLRPAWRAGADKLDGLAHPRTLLFAPDGSLYVSDVESSRLYVLSSEGRFLRSFELPEVKYPYLAGFKQDTLLIFSPDARKILFVRNDRVARSIDTPADLPGADALQYVTASDRGIFFKTVGADREGYVVSLQDDGEIVDGEVLYGPFWRHAGLLRLWGDTLVSLSGYRPVVDLVYPGSHVDTLALLGFDSPMLARSRSFALGRIDQGPLLSSSASAVGDRLFVLNLRPGWLQVDLYDRTGRLRDVLVQQDPGFDRNFYPVDLAVRRSDSGDYLIAVAVSTPPEIRAYRWQPPAILSPAAPAGSIDPSTGERP